jgi:hypothetical protein
MMRSTFAVPMVMVVAAAAGMILSAAQPAAAQQSNPCASDLKQYCPGVTPGGGRLLRCYEEKKAQFSPACAGWAELAKANAASVKAVCAKEINSSCNFEKGDPLEMLDCLQSNYVDLSDACRAKLNEFQAQYPKPVR